MNIEDIKYGQLFRIRHLEGIYCLCDRMMSGGDQKYKCVRIGVSKTVPDTLSTWERISAGTEVILLDVDIYDGDKLIYRSFDGRSVEVES